MVTAEPAGSAADDPALAESKSRLPEPSDPFAAQLRRAARAFIARRGSGKTVIAGYPWFLDWGRDTLICARGLLAAGMTADVEEILLTFARFEKDGTLPDTIHGDNTSNRDTSDAPLLATDILAGRTGTRARRGAMHIHGAFDPAPAVKICSCQGGGV